ncbi:DinB superfamily protein [Singulisphaera sp. GP187]|uniref:DinB family protein n=1 Tax=Singulisphaera sp. GP187 TaxID=1882752 RepID=UPI0009294547|nr:DinB family protein [Singulisphaera sp. GP187]SIN91091.1 DinB superfamily protein [Singulisphaera sp. GP187]
MNAKDVIRCTLGHSDLILKSYVNDLDDAELQLSPLEGMNCIAWQLGHLISSERGMVEGVKPGSCPPLPAGFDENHGKNKGQTDNSANYLSKSEYLALLEAQREATKAVLDGLSDEELDAPAPERMQRMCPTVGSVMLLTGNHVLMHLGQFVAVRRKLNKPVVI